MDYISCQQNADLQRTSLQHACFFVPVFSLYTFTPSCPLLVGTVTLRYIHVCSLYLKLCNIIRLLLFIPNNYYKYLTTGWWKHLNGTLYHIIFFSGIPMVRLSNFPCLPWLMPLSPVSPVSYFSFHQIVFNRWTGKYCNKIRLVSRLYLLKTCAVVIL